MESNMKEEDDMCSEESSTSSSREGGEEEEEEEELALFKDMKALERQEFLHRFSDDSDDSISIKLGSFSSFKFYLSGKHFDPLNADTGRTDYNWLLTPPATPLFPTLDKKTPHVEISERSKLQRKPRTSPRISRIEPSPRRTRNSSSTQHSSLLSSSSSITSHSRGRAASSTLSSRGNLNSHHSISTVRSSTDTINSSAASARSSTFQRSSTGSTSSSSPSLIGKAAPSLQGKNAKPPARYRNSCSI